MYNKIPDAILCVEIASMNAKIMLENISTQAQMYWAKVLFIIVNKYLLAD